MVSDSEYRSQLDPAVETLGMTLIAIGHSDEPQTDEQIVTRAANKLRMLYDMLLACGFHEALLQAAVRS